MSMADVLINDTHMVILGLSVLFTILAIYRRTILSDLLAMVFWFITGITHLLASPTTTPLYSISFLYWGIGLIFFVLTWVDVFQQFNIRESSRGVGPV